MYAIVDIETTGSYAAANGITEIAVFIHDGKNIIDRFETLINPLQPIPYFIQRLTGITDEMVVNAPTFEEVASQVFELLNDKIFVAHNVNFDYSFLKHQLQECGYSLETKKLCTVRLTRKVFPKLPSYSLGNICRALKISLENRHRAGGDARATVLLLEKLLAHDAQPFIAQFLKKSSGEQYLPLHISKEQMDRLPHRPGVYYFRNEKGKVIYVGKAKDLKKRVHSHFTHNGAGKQKQEFIRNIYSISYSICGTELMAAILEEAEIKKLWPVYNTSRKQPNLLYGLYSFTDQRGYLRLAIDKKRKNLRAIHTFGLLWDGYRLLWNMVERYQLSPGLCFLTTTEAENNLSEPRDEPVQYNQRVTKALENFHEELPSFAILGEGITEEDQSCLLIEKGRFFGMGYIPQKMKFEDIHRLKKKLTPYPDNDFIRNAIAHYAKDHPQHIIQF